MGLLYSVMYRWDSVYIPEIFNYAHVVSLALLEALISTIKSQKKTNLDKKKYFKNSLAPKNIDKIPSSI
jgi:hypothetical protein